MAFTYHHGACSKDADIFDAQHYRSKGQAALSKVTKNLLFIQDGTV
jgi:hypothetical protein